MTTTLGIRLLVCIIGAIAYGIQNGNKMEAGVFGFCFLYLLSGAAA